MVTNKIKRKVTELCECSCCVMSGGKAPRALIDAYEDPSFGRGAPIRSRAQLVPEPSSTPVGRGVELLIAPTRSHVARAGVWGGRAMGGRSDGGTEDSQSESRDALPVGGDRRSCPSTLG